MANAGSYDFHLDQGATFTRVLTYKDSSGTAINLTGYTCRMQVRKDVTSDTTILDLTTANGGVTVSDGAAGQITITVTDTATAALIAGSYVYDLEIESGGGIVTRLVEGKVIISAEVTR